MKSEITESPLNVRKARRDKRKTECSINRRNGCGICGSLNICIQGVVYCSWCNREEDFLVQSENWWWWGHVEFKCDCKVPIRLYKHIGKCMDCGAVMSSFCPNDKKHNCWKKLNKYYCTTCGYRK